MVCRQTCDPSTEYRRYATDQYCTTKMTAGSSCQTRTGSTSYYSSRENPNDTCQSGKGLHSSTFSAHPNHLLGNTLRGVRVSVTESAQVELESGRVSAPTVRSLQRPATHRVRHGRAVHVDPIKPKPTLNEPGTKRLIPKYVKLLSSFAFNFNLRRYSMGVGFCCDAAAAAAHCSKVGRCRLTL